MDRHGSGPVGGDGQPVAGWSPQWTLADVLGGYQSCDVFARYLVEHGAAAGTYHAALFGYCYLNQLRHLEAGTERDQLAGAFLPAGEHPVGCLSHMIYNGAAHLSDDAVSGMFLTVCEHLGGSFERFQTDLTRAAAQANGIEVATRPVVVTLRSQRVRRRVEIGYAARLCSALADLGLTEPIEPGMQRAMLMPGVESVVHSSRLVSVALVYRAPAFQLTATLDEPAVHAHNVALLQRLRRHRDTCCYLQLDDLVLLYQASEETEPALAMVRLCGQQVHDGGHPGVIERVGRPGDDGDLVVVHCPTGQDPSGVHALVCAQHAPRKVVIHPF